MAQNFQKKSRFVPRVFKGCKNTSTDKSTLTRWYESNTRWSTRKLGPLKPFFLREFVAARLLAILENSTHYKVTTIYGTSVSDFY